MVDDIEDGLMSLTDDRTIFYDLENRIQYVYNNNPQKIPDIIQFDRERSTKMLTLAFTKNSPLTPFFKRVAQKSAQLGLRDALSNEWFGGKIKPTAKPEGYPLSIGQTFLIFTTMFGSFTLSMLVYVVEVIHRQCKGVTVDFQVLKSVHLPLKFERSM